VPSHRTRLPRRLIERLVLAGACDGWGQPRTVCSNRSSAPWEVPKPSPRRDACSTSYLNPASALGAILRISGANIGSRSFSFILLRWASNRSASHSLSSTGHISLSRFVITVTRETQPM
jgi:hypothetical protein